MTSTPIERITTLESDAYRIHRALERVDGRMDHLTSAIGDLSQDGRGTALDVRELRSDMTALRSELTEMHAEMRAGFEGVLAELRATDG